MGLGDGAAPVQGSDLVPVPLQGGEEQLAQVGIVVHH